MDKQYELTKLYHWNKILPKINPNGKKIRGVKPLIRKTFFQYNFKDGFQFLDAFDINKSELYNDGNSEIYESYLFRGHKYSNWKLLPSVLRDLGKSGVKIYESGNGHSTGEVHAFSRFVKGLNALGYNISKESHDFIKILDKNAQINGSNLNNSNNDIFDFPKESHLSELALAQHYGVPTRLLDFSLNPYKAIFFASESHYPFSKIEKSKKIGIWVIPKLLINAVSVERYIKLIDVQKFQNKYIQAQEGVFLHYVPEAHHLVTKGVFPAHTIHEKGKDIYKFKTLDEVLIDNFKNEDLNKLINEHIGKPMLFTLPISELYVVANFLNQINITWETMMPSLDGVKKEVERYKNKPYDNLPR